RDRRRRSAPRAGAPEAAARKCTLTCRRACQPPNPPPTQRSHCMRRKRVSRAWPQLSWFAKSRARAARLQWARTGHFDEPAGRAASKKPPERAFSLVGLTGQLSNPPEALLADFQTLGHAAGAKPPRRAIRRELRVLDPRQARRADAPRRLDRRQARCRRKRGRS